MNQPPPTSALHSTAHPSPLDEDFSCRRCGYNVRSLPDAGNCPECGLRVGLSRLWDLLRCADQHWLRSLALGLRFMIAGIVLALLTLIVGTLLGGVHADLAPHLTLTGLLTGAGLWLAGVWFVTPPDPSGLSELDAGVSRRTVRVALILNLSLHALALARARLTAGPFPAPEATGILATIASLAALVGFLAHLNYLEQLNHRNGAFDLAGRAWLLKWFIGLSVALFALLAAVAALLQWHDAFTTFVCISLLFLLAWFVFATMYLALLARMRRDLDDELRLAAELNAPSPS